MPSALAQPAPASQGSAVQAVGLAPWITKSMGTLRFYTVSAGHQDDDASLFG